METRYTSKERKIYDLLPDGRVRIYYDEQESTETVVTVDRETEQEHSETYPIYLYLVADADSISRADLIVALVRTRYTEDDELAVQRQRDDKPGDYNAYNAFVEWCKAYTLRITEGDSLATAKAIKCAELGQYDASDDVNAFLVNGTPMWLSPNRRSNLGRACESLKAQGVTEVPFAGLTLPVDDALAMLSAIEGYAALTTFVTDTHRSNINALETVEAVEAYDYTVSYPPKLEF